MGLIKIKSNQKKEDENLSTPQKIQEDIIENEYSSFSKSIKGTKKRRVSYNKENFLNHDSGKWEKIDNSFIEKTEKYVNKKGNHQIEIFKPNINKKVNFSFKGNKVTWEYLGTHKNTQLNVKNLLEGPISEAVYVDIDDSTDISYILEGENLKENIVIKAKREFYKYSFNLKIEGLTLELSSDKKKIELKKNESVEAIIPAPYMYDDLGVVNNDVYYELEKLNDNEYVFEVIADEKWINDNNRKFPVVIDPQIVTSSENVLSYQAYGNLSGKWEVLATSDIRLCNSTQVKYKAVFTVNKDLLTHDGILNSVKLILKPKSEFETIISDGNKTVNYNSSNGDFVFDITERFISQASNFSFTLTSHSANMALFYGSIYPPYLEMEYMLEENEVPCKKIYNLSGTATSQVDLKTGNMILSFTDVSAENSVMGLEISHVFNKSFENSFYGNGYKLNIDEKLQKYDDETYIYTDSLGEKHVIRQYFYYIASNNNKIYIDKSLVEVDTSGNLKYTSNFTYDVKVEYKSDTGLEASTKLENIKYVDYLDQRTSKVKEIEEKIETYKNSLKDYIVIHPIERINEDGKTEFVIEFLDNLMVKNLLDNKEAMLSFINTVSSNEEYYPLTISEAADYWRINYDNNRMIAEIEKLQEKLTNIEHYEFIAHAQEFYRNSITEDIEDYQEFYDYYTGKLDSLRNRKDEILFMIEKYHKEYIYLKEELEIEIQQTPVNFLIGGSLYKGFNESGDIVVVFDKYGNQAVIGYEKYYNSNKELYYRVSQIYDDKDCVKFIYENTMLNSIIDKKGRKVTFNYENSVLTFIKYDNGKVVDFTYVGGVLSTVTNNQNMQISAINYYDDKVVEIINSSLVNEIPDVTAVNSLPVISSIGFEYEKDSSTFTITKAKITYDDKIEIYYFDSTGFNNKYLLIQDEYVTNAEMYEFVPYYKGTVKQTNPHSKVTYAKESSLYQKIDDFQFEDGVVKTVTLGNFNQPLTTTVNSINVSLWTDENGVTRTTQKNTITLHEYDKNQKLIKDKTIVNYINPPKQYTLFKLYHYNQYGSLIKTEEYVEGEELTFGITISEIVYDKNGNITTSFTYNSLDSSSKFYNHITLDEKERVSQEFDEIGNNFVKYNYLGNTSLVSDKELPNGSKLAFGYDSYNRTTAISQSTNDGEENSNQIKYQYDCVVETKTNNSKINYKYDHKGRMTHVYLNGPLYAYLTHSENRNSNNLVTEYVSSIEHNGRPIQITTRDYNGNVISKAVNSSGGVYLTNEYSKGKITLSHDWYSNKCIYFTRDSLDRITNISYDNFNESIVYNENGLVSQKNIDGLLYNYYYKDNYYNDLECIDVDEISIEFAYDCLHRRVDKYITADSVTTEHLSYYKIGDHTTNLISSITFDGKEKLSYAYDNMGNISKVYDNGELAIRYEYDGLNRLSREDNKYLSKTTLFLYHDGNLIKKREFPFTLKGILELEELESLDTIYEYQGDRLIKYNGNSCVYDASGRVSNYLGNAVSWDGFGYITKIGNTTFTYYLDGRRKSKNSLTFKYDTQGKLLSTSDMQFIYDTTGVCGVKYNGNTYLYRKNAQGDIIAILDNECKIVVKYIYDAWGNHVVVDNEGNEITNASHVGNKNPLRYRGYYYDVETKLYYCKTRYYSSELCRWISIDSVQYLVPQRINGLNLYAYCDNNPVNRVDYNGNSWNSFWKKAKDYTSTVLGLLNPISKITAVGSVVVATLDGRWDAVVDDWRNGCFNLFNQSEEVALKAKVLGFYKGSTLVRHNFDGTCSILGTIWSEGDLNPDDLNHEYGHSIQERTLGPAYLFTVAVPSVAYYWYDVKNNRTTRDYYSMPWERTADWLGGVNRGNYKKDSLAWAIAENLLGPIVIPFYLLFGF